MKITIYSQRCKPDKLCKNLLEDFLDCVFSTEIFEILAGALEVSKISLELEEGEFNEEESPPED